MKIYSASSKKKTVEVMSRLIVSGSLSADEISTLSKAIDIIEKYPLGTWVVEINCKYQE